MSAINTNVCQHGDEEVLDIEKAHAVGSQARTDIGGGRTVLNSGQIDTGNSSENGSEKTTLPFSKARAVFLVTVLTGASFLNVCLFATIAWGGILTPKFRHSLFKHR